MKNEKSRPVQPSLPGLQMEEEIEENKTSNAPMVPAYNHFKTETEELNRIFANAYDFFSKKAW